MRVVNIADPELTYDPEDPERFRSGVHRLGLAAGARETGASVYALAPGVAICPYHYEQAEEEWLLVLIGRPTLRHPQGERELRESDVVCFPAGPEHAHLVRNDTPNPVRVLMFSTVRFPAVTVYPDSDKIGVFTREEELLVHRSSGVGYYSGE
ncbi:MAG: cupin domain-containing protein [Solirubrobacterales bacterium]|nr:cupin domain-containing protein [Solirubrobacterales bacterium]